MSILILILILEIPSGLVARIQRSHCRGGGGLVVKEARFGSGSFQVRVHISLCAVEVLRHNDE